MSKLYTRGVASLATSFLLLFNVNLAVAGPIPLFSANVGLGDFGGASSSDRPTLAEASIQSPPDAGGPTGRAEARAGTDYGLGVFGHVNFFCCGTSLGAGGVAQVTFDILLSGAPGVTMTDIQMNLELHAISNDPSFNTGGFVSLLTRVEASSAAGAVRFLSTRASFEGGEFSAGLPLLNLSGPTLMTTDPMRVAVGSPTTITIWLEGGATGFGATESLTMNAMNTLWFPSTGPIFNLPAGIVLADIPELRIFNNSLRQPGQDPGQVPEPASLGLMALGLAAAGLTRLRSRRRTSGHDAGRMAGAREH